VVIAVSADGTYVAGGWAIAHNSPRVFRVSDHADVTPSMPGVWSLLWSPQGHTLYIVSRTGVQAWTPGSGVGAVTATTPWILQPNFSPDGSLLAYTALTTSRDVRASVYDFKARSSRVLVNKPRSGANFVKSGWIWYLEEKPCVESNNNVCFDPTQPDGTMLALNLATGQESPVVFAAGEAPFQGPGYLLERGDVWPPG
jgi:hypothetical protein